MRSAARFHRPFAWSVMPLLALVFSAAQADVTTDFRLSLTADDNRNNGVSGGDTRSDIWATLDAGVSRPWRIANNAQLVLRGSATISTGRFKQLDSLGANISAESRWRTGQGFHATAFSVIATGGFASVHGDGRNGKQLRAVATAHKPFTTHLTALAGAEHARTHADGLAYSTRHSGLFAEIEWAATRQSTAYAGIDLRQGRFTSVGTPRANVLANAIAQRPDDTFGPGETAFLLQGRTSVFTAGVHRVLSPGWAVDLRGRAINTRSDAGSDYRRHQISINLIGVFGNS